MKISREWATPLTIGSFLLMAVTGILMFFHLDMGLNKLAHEWLGWIMVAGVIAHAVANWGAFKRYFIASASGRAIIAAGVLVLAGSFATLPGGARDGFPPHIMAMKAVARAPIANVAPVAGRPADALLKDLAGAGISLPDSNASIESVVGGNRELEAKAMAVLFKSTPRR
ncbi:MAG: DUF4405 domain-containing protein [Hyphomicrobiaceae bacterium]|nr:DUF4405 domain-containing protein [Hyphomicrobiaceae bacterium]